MKLYSEAISVKSHLPITNAVSLRLVSYCFSIQFLIIVYKNGLNTYNIPAKGQQTGIYWILHSTNMQLADYSMNIYIYEYL